MAGASMLVTKRDVFEEEFWDLFENEHVTAFHGVANSYDMLRQMEIFCEDFPELRIMTQAGGKLNRELHRYYAQYARDNGKLFFVLYGQSEATAGISYLPPERSLEKLGSVGVPYPGGKLELIDAEGKTIEEAHVPGELIYRGENAALGYASSGEDLKRGDDWRGEIHTGDIAEWDEEGFLYITGRIRRFIKIGGHRISLDEIDEQIMNDLHVRCVSSGVDDHLVLFVLREEDEEAVREYIREKISIARSCFRTAKIDAFPVNEGGKILYGKLLEEAEALKLL
jgi:acyl-coenzyme A synthetase/AMP-(fatty) acid ligase